MLNSEVVYRELEFWSDLSYKLSVEETRILELVYKNKTSSLNNLIKELKIKYKIKLSKSTIIRKINTLKDYGIIGVVKGCPLFINEIIGIEENIRKLLTLSKEGHRLK